MATQARILRGLALLVALAGTMSSAAAIDIHTGGETGAYHTTFCPLLRTSLERTGRSAQCVTSQGTRENMRRLRERPGDLAYGQTDVLALEAQRDRNGSAFTILRSDDARECVFAVTRRKDLTNYGELAVWASALRFVLPPRESGSAGTFEFLQSIDPTGLGAARDIEYATTTDEAIRKALADDYTVTFFVQFADPSNPRFKLIDSLGGHIVPVIDRTILRQQIDGRAIYLAQETEVVAPKWLSESEKVITACTPLAVFTGNAERLADTVERARHRELADAVRDITPNDLLPRQGWFRRLLKRTKELSARSADRIVDLTEKARERTRPLVEQAKEKGRDVIRDLRDKAKPAGAR